MVPDRMPGSCKGLVSGTQDGGSTLGRCLRFVRGEQGQQFLGLDRLDQVVIDTRFLGAALVLLLDAGTVPTFDAVRELVRPPRAPSVPALAMPTPAFEVYDQLLTGRCADGR